MNKYLCIIQARMDSTRLPGKVLLKVDGMTVLEYLIKRVRQAKGIGKIVVATSQKKSNDPIENICKKLRVACFRGSEEDVLDRFNQCSLANPGYKYVIRLTGDNPLIDPSIINEVISFTDKHGECDYISNNLTRTFPYGLDVEIIKVKALAEAAVEAKSKLDREHVTSYIKRNRKFKKGSVINSYDFSHFRLTVDSQEDFEKIKSLVGGSKISDGYFKYISLLTKNNEY